MLGEEQVKLNDIISELRADTPTGHELVLASVRRAILTNALAPGTRLRQEELAEVFGTSRIPVREALRALEYEGLVTSLPHRGFTVAALEADDIEEVYDIRAVLETYAVRLALPLLTTEDLDDLEAMFADMQSALTPDAQLAARERFYRRLFSVTGRPRLVGLIMRLRQEVARSLRWGTIQHSSEIHAQFFDAVRVGDADRAVAHLTSHYRRVALLIRRRIKETKGRSPDDHRYSS